MIFAIKKLKSSLTVGVDNVPSLIVKGCIDGFIYPLIILFNFSLKTNTFPDVWKQTKIIPVYKKGATNDWKVLDPLQFWVPFLKYLKL